MEQSGEDSFSLLPHHLLLLHSQWAAACCLCATTDKWYTINHHCSVVGSQFVTFAVLYSNERALRSSYADLHDSQLIIYSLYVDNCSARVKKTQSRHSCRGISNQMCPLCFDRIEWLMCLFALHNRRISATGRTTDVTDSWLAKWAKRASQTRCISLAALRCPVALNGADRAEQSGRRTYGWARGSWSAHLAWRVCESTAGTRSPSRWTSLCLRWGRVYWGVKRKLDNRSTIG